uniref:Uncharacterized protein n=1 Tax=Molossus molossus TaxID=27622 RepID=A0A7J8JVU5_MOLMO|nr:hypothetical protein HJG59_007966 [Molossus molossus]
MSGGHQDVIVLLLCIQLIFLTAGPADQQWSPLGIWLQIHKGSNFYTDKNFPSVEVSTEDTEFIESVWLLKVPPVYLSWHFWVTWLVIIFYSILLFLPSRAPFAQLLPQLYELLFPHKTPYFCNICSSSEFLI